MSIDVAIHDDLALIVLPEVLPDVFEFPLPEFPVVFPLVLEPPLVFDPPPLEVPSHCTVQPSGANTAL